MDRLKVVCNDSLDCRSVSKQLIDFLEAGQFESIVLLLITGSTHVPSVKKAALNIYEL